MHIQLTIQFQVFTKSKEKQLVLKILNIQQKNVSLEPSSNLFKCADVLQPGKRMILSILQIVIPILLKKYGSLNKSLQKNNGPFIYHRLFSADLPSFFQQHFLLVFVVLFFVSSLHKFFRILIPIQCLLCSFCWQFYKITLNVSFWSKVFNILT